MPKLKSNRFAYYSNELELTQEVHRGGKGYMSSEVYVKVVL